MGLNENIMIFHTHLSSPQNPSQSQLPKVQNIDIEEEYRKFSENYEKFLTTANKALYPDPSFTLPLITQTQGLDKSIQGPKPFALVLGTRLPSSICKCKYFSFKIYLKQQAEYNLPVNQVIDLEVLIFTQDGILITRNMKGKEILKGNSLQSMSFYISENAHIAYFRIQITEVSSHYIGKKIIMKIRPKKNEFLQSLGWKIQPFSMELTVKAKELKIKNK